MALQSDFCVPCGAELCPFRKEIPSHVVQNLFHLEKKVAHYEFPKNATDSDASCYGVHKNSTGISKF